MTTQQHAGTAVRMPGDGVRPIVEAFAGELVAQLDDQINGGLRQLGGVGVRTARPRFKRGLPPRRGSGPPNR